MRVSPVHSLEQRRLDRQSMTAIQFWKHYGGSLKASKKARRKRAMLFPYFSTKEIKKEGVSGIAVFYLLAAVFVLVMFYQWSNWTFSEAGKQRQEQFVIEQVSTAAPTVTPVNDFVFLPGAVFESTPTPVNDFLAAAPDETLVAVMTLRPVSTPTPEYALTELFTLTALHESLSLTPPASPTFTPTGWVWIAPVTVVWLPQTVEVPVTVISHEVEIYETIFVVTAVPTRTASPSPTPSPSPTSTLTPISTQTEAPTMESTWELTAESTFESTEEAAS
jgi:hypothetical protein